MKIQLALIKPSPHPVRSTWDEDKLNELAQSLKEQGQIVPIKVRLVEEIDKPEKCCRWHDFDWIEDSQDAPGEDYGGTCLVCDELRAAHFHVEPSATYDPEEYGEFDPNDPDNISLLWEPGDPAVLVANKPLVEIIYGHRRVEAARRAGLTDVEAIVEGVDDTDALIQALIENLQREDMTPMDTARGLAALKAATGWTNRDIAERGIMSIGQVSKILSLLDQPEEIQHMVKSDSDGITPYHVLETKTVLEDPALKTAVLQKAASEGLTAQQTRRVAESVAAAPTAEAKAKLLEWEYSPVIHDQKTIRERTQRYGAYDPMYRDVTPRVDEWKQSPEVIGVIDTLKEWLRILTEFRKTADIGKMSPEAKRFIARRITDFANTLLEWANDLEK